MSRFPGACVVHSGIEVVINGESHGRCDVRVYDTGIEVSSPHRSLYYEIHVTIAWPDEPVAPGWESPLKAWALERGWHMGDLLMIKGGGTVQSRKDLFFTNRAGSYAKAHEKMVSFVNGLRKIGREVIRYKIEDTVLDSNVAPEGEL